MCTVLYLWGETIPQVRGGCWLPSWLVPSIAVVKHMVQLPNPGVAWRKADAPRITPECTTD